MLTKLLNLFGIGRKSQPVPDSGEVADGVRMAFTEIVIVQVTSEDPAVIRKQISRITDLTIEHGGTTKNMQSDIVIAVFEAGAAPYGKAPNSLGFKAAVFGASSDDIRGLYGTVQTVRGNLGGERRMEYGHLFPGLTEALEHLDEIEPGDVQKHEFPNWFGDEEPGTDQP